MDAYVRGFWLPKAGNRPVEYEDAALPRKASKRSINDKPRFAVADGATETAFSGLWARQLVSAFVRKRLGLPADANELLQVRRKWAATVRKRPLPWYLEEAITRGAYAAFVGIELELLTGVEPVEGVWTAVASGDCCLVQIRGSKVLATFPFTASEEFDSRPHGLISSLPMDDEDLLGADQVRQGSWNMDDTFFLMTDAIALWFWHEWESGRAPWDTLRNLDFPGGCTFVEFVRCLRDGGHIKNDDVTLLRVDVC